jgi:hypothetical protein
VARITPLGRCDAFYEPKRLSRRMPRPIVAFSRPIEQGRHEALLCRTNAKKIRVVPSPFARTRECGLAA